MDFCDLLRAKGTCCIDGKPLKDCQHINLVAIDYVATWEYPSEKNVYQPHRPRRAVAVIHDDHVPNGRTYAEAEKIQFAIEVKDDEIIYHPVSSLMPIDIPDN